MSYVPNPQDVNNPTDAISAETAQAEFRALKSYIATFQNLIQAWNPADKSDNVSLTGGNLLATQSMSVSNYQGGRALLFKSSGKWYWEVDVISILSTPQILGIALLTWDENTFVGQNAGAIGYGGATGQKFVNGVTSAFGAAFIAGNVIGFALDLNGNTLQVLKNNVSLGTIAIPAGLYYPAYSQLSATDSLYGLFDQQRLAYAPPAGFSAFYNSGASAYSKVNTRQTIITGSTDANGLANLLSIGATVLTVDLKATAVPVSLTIAQGFMGGLPQDLVQTISADVVAAWTVPDASTSFLYVDYTTSNPVFGSTILAPVYQWGGPPSIANGQHTYVISSGVMWVGNGIAATQVNRVFFGEIISAGGIVTGGTSYAYNGIYQGPWITPLPTGGTTASIAHNLGTLPTTLKLTVQNITGELGWTALDIAEGVLGGHAGAAVPLTMRKKRTTIDLIVDGSGLMIENIGGATFAAMTLAKWNYSLYAARGW